MNEKLCDIFPLRREGSVEAAGFDLIKGEVCRIYEGLAEPGERGLEIVVFVNGVLTIAGRR